MKNTILALALTAAAVPFTFAAQTAASPATPSATGSSTASKTAAKTTTKKAHKKGVKKSTVKSDSGAVPASGGSAPAAAVKK
ncbi:MAG: hypothetical protein WBY44_35960 [Bryobacteraceae bacterium]|jgi:hypothetical protein